MVTVHFPEPLKDWRLSLNIRQNLKAQGTEKIHVAPAELYNNDLIRTVPNAGGLYAIRLHSFPFQISTKS